MNLRRRYNLIIQGYGRKRDFKGVQDTVREMQVAGIPPNQSTHGCLVAALTRCGELERAMSALRVRLAPSHPPRACSHSHRPLPQSGQRMDPPPGVRAYTALIQGLAAAARFDECLVLMEEMKSAGIQPNVVTFSTLLDGLVNHSRLQEAHKLLSTMQAAGVPANTVTYSTLMKGFAAAGDLQSCNDVMKQMTAAGLQPNLFSFNTLLNACVPQRDIALLAEVQKQARLLFIPSGGQTRQAALQHVTCQRVTAGGLWPSAGCDHLHHIT